MVAHNRSVPLKASCCACGDEYYVLVDLDDLEDWIDGKGYAQDIFHYLTPNERELIISATCPLCWDLIENHYSSDDCDS